jgi:hypothetical protein
VSERAIQIQVYVAYAMTQLQKGGHSNNDDGLIQATCSNRFGDPVIKKSQTWEWGPAPERTAKT